MRFRVSRFLTRKIHDGLTPPSMHDPNLPATAEMDTEGSPLPGFERHTSWHPRLQPAITQTFKFLIP